MGDYDGGTRSAELNEKVVAEPMPVRPSADLGRRVFLVHGRDHSARDALIALLRAFDLKVIQWRDAAAHAGGGTPYTGDIVAAGMDLADAVVILLTPDDVGYVRQTFREANDGPHELQPTGQARLNVIFEAGMAMARDRHRVVLVELGQVRKLSDTDGLNVIRIYNSIESRKDLAQRLRSAGLSVDIDGEEWRTAGSFDRVPLTTVDLEEPYPPSTPATVEGIANDATASRLVQETEEIKALAESGGVERLHFRPLIAAIERDIRLNLHPPFSRKVADELSSIIRVILDYVVEDLANAPANLKRPVTGPVEIQWLQEEGEEILDDIEPYARLADHYSIEEARRRLDHPTNEVSRALDELSNKARSLKKRVVKYLQNLYKLLGKVDLLKAESLMKISDPSGIKNLGRD